MDIKRNYTESLERWFDSPFSEPLLIFGPRQVGKSHTTKKFITSKNRNIIEVNFWKNPNFSKIFFTQNNLDLNPENIISRLEILLGKSISIEHDILFFDEIQDCFPAYQSLKFFKEDLPQLKIIASGSYLRLSLETIPNFTKVPVGNTTDILMRPIRFSEFLENVEPILFKFYQKVDIFSSKPLDEVFHEKFLYYFHLYQFVGGMPEPQKIFLSQYKISQIKAIQSVRKKQFDLLEQYKLDLNKFAKNSELAKIKKLFETIPLQLNQYAVDSSQRFNFKDVAGTQGYKKVKGAFDYLIHSGFVLKSQIISDINEPFVAAEEKEKQSIFKAYWFDTGLLNASIDISFQSIMEENLNFYKGFIAENFVAQELSYAKNHLYSYKSSSKEHSAEIEFLIRKNNKTIPIEVKSSIKSTRSKSLKSYVEKFQPSIAFKLTPHNISANPPVIQLPIYLIGKIVDWQSMD